MVEHDNTKRLVYESIEAKYKNTLDLKDFFLMLKDPTFSYKFYWLEAIVKLISEGKNEASFDEIIDEMIVNAWYTVVEFHIHLSGYVLGEVKDQLELAVVKLSEVSNLKSNSSKMEIKEAIKLHNEDLNKYKTQLTKYVPFRALAGFFDTIDIKIELSNSTKTVNIIRAVNEDKSFLPYTITDDKGLEKVVKFSSVWIDMIRDNTVSILGWIQNEKLKYLQANNPEVPGLVYKLVPLDEKMRRLKRVHTIWDAIMETKTIYGIFSQEVLNDATYAIDHFLPWSFVMNDELWNLMPMEASLNSSKSNNLPKWEPFFKRFADNQYIMYESIHKENKIMDIFKTIYKDNLHSLWAIQDLYRAGNSKDTFQAILEKNMKPIYDSAERQGYEVWNY